MIQIKDKFLPKEIFEKFQAYCVETPFKVIDAGEKSFSILETPDYLLNYLQIEGYELFLTFVRNAYKNFDNDLRIHADNIIQGHRTDFASVLYINNPEGVTPNGTSFWEHTEYGKRLPLNIPNADFDRLIIEDSNVIEKWQQTDIIMSSPNKMLLYDASLFHSKWPQIIEQGTRIVLVCFYKQNK